MLYNQIWKVAWKIWGRIRQANFLTFLVWYVTKEGPKQRNPIEIEKNPQKPTTTKSKQKNPNAQPKPNPTPTKPTQHYKKPLIP